jgi:hypothetical protein
VSCTRRRNLRVERNTVTDPKPYKGTEFATAPYKSAQGWSVIAPETQVTQLAVDCWPCLHLREQCPWFGQSVQEARQPRCVRWGEAFCACVAADPGSGMDRRPWMKSVTFRHRPEPLWPPAQTCPAGVDDIPTRPLPPAGKISQTGPATTPPGAGVP